MQFISPEIISVISVFATAFTVPTWSHAQTLLIGAILCHGPRRITSILRVMGLSHENRFERYHRVLNRASWSGIKVSKLLFGLIITLISDDKPIVIAIDETLERRKGKKIKAKGWYYDAVRSSKRKAVTCPGLKWICMCLTVTLPWSNRPWALPFLTALAPSKKANETSGKSHKTVIDWTISLISLVSRWMKKKKWILVADGTYACVRLAHHCVLKNVSLVCRLRMDACLYDFAIPRKPGQRGRTALKGKRLPSLKALLEDQNQSWDLMQVRWYGDELKDLLFLTGVCLWHTSGQKPVCIRWVLIRDPTGKLRDQAFFCTDSNHEPKEIIQWFILRWNIEVTFEEVRAHLGVETQRQWSDKAIARSTPALMGLFSITCLIACNLAKTCPQIPKCTAWYSKANQSTFSDVIATVRRNVWAAKYLKESTSDGNLVKIHHELWSDMIDRLSLTG